MKIVIIGTGNVAQVLGRMLLAANHTILQVYGRDQKNLEVCAALLKATPVTDLTLIDQTADICIIATSDSTIASVASHLRLSDTIVVHTSGGVAMQVLNKHPRFGVLYPLQSLRKELQYLPKVPLFIDANNENVKADIIALARTIAAEVHVANDAERLKLHVAAVFCSNFTNHLFALADQFCHSEGLSFDYLLPLIEETVHRMEVAAPAHLQTGPAIRRDELTIQKHLQVLQPYPMLANIYSVLTKSIQDNEEKS